jgi:pimeloyl-ACP methyl ester carboxylesterase
MATTPAEASAAAPVEAEPVLNYGPLIPDRIDEYGNHIVTAQDQPHWAWPLLESELDLAAHGIPLPLCEFLAYKSALAYRKPAEIITNLTQKYRGIAHAEFFDSRPNGDTQGYGFVYQDTAFIIMRGTDTRQKQLEDVDVHMVGDRHRGFQTGWNVIKDKIESWVDSLPRRDRHRFVFSGHSLGGALAFLGAYEFATKAKPRSVGAVVTFGAPKVGNARFKQQYDALLGNRTLRIEANGDAVPHLPNLSSYAAVGQQWVWKHRPLVTPKMLENAGAALAAALKAEAEKQLQSQQQAQQQKTEAEHADKPGQAKPPADAPTTPQDNSNIVMLVVLGVFAAIGALIAWLWVREKIAAHAIQKDYALLLSTLSYRRLRELRNGDFERANSELSGHLACIRGKDDDVFDQLGKGQSQLPVRIRSADQLSAFEKLASSALNETYKNQIC